jgi:hypothetical protein
MHKVRLLIKLSWIFVPHRDRCQCCQSLLLWGCQRWGTTDDDSVGANANGEHEADMEAEGSNIFSESPRLQENARSAAAIHHRRRVGGGLYR